MSVKITSNTCKKVAVAAFCVMNLEMSALLGAAGVQMITDPIDQADRYEKAGKLANMAGISFLFTGIVMAGVATQVVPRLQKREEGEARAARLRAFRDDGPN